MNQKIRVLHVQLLPLLTGAQNTMLHLIKNLDPEKFEFSVVSAPGNPLEDKLKELQVSHYTIAELHRNIHIKDAIVLYKLYRLCRWGKFDIVHTHSSKTGFLGRIAAKLAGIRGIIHTVQGFPFHPYQKKVEFIFYRILEKIATYFCDRIISVNRYEYEMAISSNFIQKNKIGFIHNAVEPVPLHFQNHSENLRIRSKLGFSAEDIIVGSVSRFTVPKNNLILVDIALSIVQQNEKIKFIFLGDGKDLQEARVRVIAAKCHDKILLPGFQHNVPNWLKIFDIFILYSSWEGLPLSILEAMSFGKPIIASNIKGNNELVENGVNGILIEIGDYDGVKKAIFWLATRGDIREKMGKKSSEIVKERFSFSRFLKKYEAEYYRLYERGK
ncbi:MAG: glycosyltransferase family 4 protein [Candidatus Cloacimonadia bacterium]